MNLEIYEMDDFMKLEIKQLKLLEEQLHQIQIKQNGGIDVSKLENGEKIQDYINLYKKLVSVDDPNEYYEVVDEIINELQPKEIKELGRIEQRLNGFDKHPLRYSCRYFIPGLVMGIILNYFHIPAELSAFVCGIVCMAEIWYIVYKEQINEKKFDKARENVMRLYNDKSKVKKMTSDYLRRMLLDSKVSQDEIDCLFNYLDNINSGEFVESFDDNVIDLIDNVRKRGKSSETEVKISDIITGDFQNKECSSGTKSNVFYATYVNCDMNNEAFSQQTCEQSGILIKTDDGYYDVLTLENISVDNINLLIGLDINLNELSDQQLIALIKRIDEELDDKSTFNGFENYDAEVAGKTGNKEKSYRYCNRYRHQ